MSNLQKNRQKLALLAALGCAVASANAQWTVTNLYPAGSTYSVADAVGLGIQAGSAKFGTVVRAGFWSNTAASWIDLHPANSTWSIVYGVDGGRQYGAATIGGKWLAGTWNSTAASWVSLHPSGANESRIFGANEGLQVGYSGWIGQGYHAGFWNDTAASWVSLHPAGTYQSVAYDCAGGKQVGYVMEAQGSNSLASMWSGTANSWVNLHPTQGVYSSATCISGNRQGGYARVGTSTVASLWSGTASTWVNLNPAGATNSNIDDMSGDLQVGYAEIGGKRHAAVWSGTAGSFVDLHAYLPTSYSSSELKAIWRSDTTVYVVGYAQNAAGQFEAVMWSRPLAGGFALSLNKSTVAGQNSVQGTITMNAAPATNAVFNTWDNSSLVTTPASVTVLMNTTTKNFQITTTAITSTINTTIYAQRGAETRSQPLTLTPLIPTALSFTPNPVVGGQSTSCRVVINGVAGPTGRTIAILDNSPNATVPATVVVPPGGTSVTFSISTTPVTSVKTVTVTARVSAGEKTATFRINP